MKKLIVVANGYYQIKGAIPITNLISIADYNSLSNTPSPISVYYFDQKRDHVVNFGEYLVEKSNKPFCIKVGSQDYDLLTSNL